MAAGDEIIDIALPTTAARPDARIVFASTGGGPVGRAYETFFAGLDQRSALVRSFSWRLKDAKWVRVRAQYKAELRTYRLDGTFDTWYLPPALKHQGEVRTAAFSPDGTRVITASGNHARGWDARGGSAVGSGDPEGRAVERLLQGRAGQHLGRLDHVHHQRRHASSH